MKITTILCCMISGLIAVLAPKAEAVVVNLGGTDYDISLVSTTYDASSALLMNNPWWDDSGLATIAVNLVGTDLGIPNSNPPFADIGPVFSYQVTSDPPFGDSVQSMALSASPSGGVLSVSGRSDSTTDTFEFAVATAVPEPSSAFLIVVGFCVIDCRRSRS